MRPVDGRHHHVFEGRHSRQEIEVLEDEADLAASAARLAPFRQAA